MKNLKTNLISLTTAALIALSLSVQAGVTAKGGKGVSGSATPNSGVHSGQSKGIAGSAEPNAG